MTPADDPRSRFVREYFAFVWRVLRRFGLGPTDADDATQSVMLVAVRRLEDIEQGSERAFLYRTAAFVAAREHRGRRRRREDMHADLDRELHPDKDAEAQLLERSALAALDRVLLGMPSDLRAVFVLAEIEGFSKQEMAEALGIPEGTVASRLRRARQDFARRARRSMIHERPKGATG